MGTNDYNVIYWQKAYSIGHEKIDSEHKRLFDIASEVFKYSNDSKKIMIIIKELVKYTKIHFKNEEEYMKSLGYINLLEHKEFHFTLVGKLNKIIKDINSLSLETIISQLTKLVNIDILEHILIEDKKVHHSRKTREELKSNFKWNSDYKLNQQLIDSEHKELFAIAIKALNYNDSDIKIHIKITIKELYSYMQNHFEHEEQYMEGINYPDLEYHKILHENIISQMNSFIKTIPTLKIVDFERKLIEYMDIWLINHILYEDRKIIKFMS
jgi:hemerythrin